MDDLIAKVSREITFLNSEGFSLNDERIAELLKECRAALSSQWVSVDDEIPDDNEVVDLFNRLWIDEDFNRHGMREGHLIHNVGWQSAEWESYQECWNVSEDAPTHWKRRSLPPIEQEQEK